MPDNTEKTLNVLAAKAFKLIGPFLLGALLTMMVNFNSDHRQTANNSQDIQQLQEQVAQLKDNYATNKRVDDLQAEVRSNYTSLSSKIDDVLKILISGKR